MSSNTIQKAGAIILSKEDGKRIALLYRAKQDDWSFPKGHIEKGEDPMSAMIREMREETGLSVRVLRRLPDMNYTHSSGETISVKMFLVKSEDDTLLRPESAGDIIQWVSPAEAIPLLSYDNLKEYLKGVASSI